MESNTLNDDTSSILEFIDNSFLEWYAFIRNKGYINVTDLTECKSVLTVLTCKKEKPYLKQ